MADKYYVTNGNKVLKSVSTSSGVVYKVTNNAENAAAHFKYQRALDLISSELNGDISWSAQKVCNRANKKNYIVTNASNFIGDNKQVTNIFANAKAFRSVADADAYIRNNKDVIKYFGNTYIVNSNFEPVNRTARKTFTQEQLATIGVKAKPSRVIASTAAKHELYEEAKHRCSICGKPISYTEMTVDHIIPVSRGGGNSRDNLRCVCHECNAIKGNKLDSEMYKEMLNMCSIKMYEDPDNKIWDDMIRAKVRGTIKKIKQ